MRMTWRAVLIAVGGVALAQDVGRTAFEVASVKTCDPSDARSPYIAYPSGRLSAVNAPLRMLIGWAFDLYSQRDYTIALPEGWANSQTFDIEAHVSSPDEVPAGPAGVAKMRLMTQSLLVDRFQLAVHRETQEKPIYRLVIHRGGPRFKKSEVGADQGFRLGKGILSAHSTSLDVLVSLLARQLGRPVKNETGLTGPFDLELKFTPDSEQRSGLFSGEEATAPGLAAPSDAPSLFTALQEQLGLRLESGKGPIEVLIVDRVNKPTAN